MNKLICYLSLLTFLYSCKKENIVKPEPLPEITNTTGYVDIDITNMAGNLTLSLNTGTYTNANNDTFSVDIFKYYLTNVDLVTTDNVTYSEIESYYLIDESKSNSKHLIIKNVPYADYKSISFLIGVDAGRNTSGAQTGALDVANDMFWTWSSGYIMAKLEGRSPQSSSVNNAFTYHIGGFQGLYTGIRKVNLNFPNNATVYKNHTPTVQLKADVAQWFSNPNTISITTTNIVTSVSATSKAIADNYKNMFTITSVIN